MLPAQDQEQPGVTFKTDVKVVNLFANVLTKKGEIINDLSKDDFVLLEDGRPQAIQYFSRETDLPLTLGLLVDTSASQDKVIESERTACFRFLDQVLRDGKDHVFILQFDTNVLVRQGLTASFGQLNEALAAVNTQSRKELQQVGGSTLLYDAVVFASQDVLKKQQGRKASIVLTDGVDFGSEATVATAIDAAQRADMILYSILFSDSHYYGGFGGHDGRNVLQQMSRETGGGFFEVSKKESIDQIFRSIEGELRSQYNLGYVSDKPVHLSEFRKLQLSTKQKDLVVQARDRYWAKR
jgi:VWFA-related protein